MIGHIPEGYEPIEYMASGISSVEHTDVLLRSLSYLEEPLSFVEAIGRLRGEYLDSLAISMKVNEVAQTMTLVAYENFIKQGPEEQQQMIAQMQAQQAAAAKAQEDAIERATSSPGGTGATPRTGFVEDDPRTWGTPSRNDACPCGSGKKFKHCHGRLA